MQHHLGNARVSRLLVQRDPQARPPLLSAYAPATNVQAYITLVRELERQFPERNSLEVLAMLRQAYYGRPWSVDPTRQWSDVVTGGPSPASPESRLGSGPGTLFDALKRSQEVSLPQPSGQALPVDMGHVFVGIETLFHPTSNVALTQEILGQQIVVQVVNMPNTEFATWGGDLGSAAGQAIADRAMGNPVRGGDLDYFTWAASDADLEGDIDAFGVVRGGGGAAGLRGMLQAPGTAAPGTPVSQVLGEYYLGSSRLAGAHATRYRDFVGTIGGVISGTTITNKSALEGPIATRVGDFARVWFWKEYKKKFGTVRTAAVYSNLDPIVAVLAVAKARSMVRLFFAWLERRL